MKDRGGGFASVIEAAPAGADGNGSLLTLAESSERTLLLAGCPEREARCLATIRLVARLLRDTAAGRSERSAGRAIARAARFCGLPKAAVRLMAGDLALRDAQTVVQAPREAIRTQLRIAASLASLREVSLWLAEPGSRLECVTHVHGAASEGTARAARRAFAESTATPASAGRELVGVPVRRASTVIGALAGRTPRGLAGVAVMTLENAAPLVELVLEREMLLESADAHSAEATGAAERALVRFGFDVHDGPAQEVAALQADIRRLEGQVRTAFAENPRATELLIGRLLDLEARSGAVADQVRAVARSARSPAALEEPVEEVLSGELRALRGSTGIEAELAVSGPVDVATPSQRIALLRGIQEALRNVREHSGARRVSLRVAAGEDRIEAEVSDDGCGFDAERVFAAASLAGHMGLAGIVERVRLIGGDCEVRSAPGGPTSIRMSLPRWKPS
ncbi:MAG: hypothetical protein FVQ78_08805 [Solirubrobacterales bacterium]|nr:hypothetical protein [Solirubrobacterales bacterium]